MDSAIGTVIFEADCDRAATACGVRRFVHVLIHGVHVRRSDSNVENGISMDQIAAKALERERQYGHARARDASSPGSEHSRRRHRSCTTAPAEARSDG